MGGLIVSIRYTLRRLREGDVEGEKFKDNLKDFELASVKPSGRVVIRLGDNIINLVDAADEGAIEACRLWAVSESSPDGEDDQRSPTGKTMSSRSWALAMIDSANQALERANQALTIADTTLRNAQTSAENAASSAQHVDQVVSQLDQRIRQISETEQSIGQDITLINQRLTQTEQNLRTSTELLNHLYEITDADEVRY